MKKTQLIIIGLLILAAGFAAGWATQRALAVKRIHKVAEMRRAKGFGEHFYRRIEADEAQRAALAPIVDRYAVQMDSLHSGFHQDRRSIIEQMHAELKPLLSPEQSKALERFSKRYREGGKRGRKSRSKD